MCLISLQRAKELAGIEDWELTPPQERFLVVSTTELVQRHGGEWIRQSRHRLQQELEIVFREV